jgi:hypothetical protein
VLSGADVMADYQWKPEGKAQANLHYHFCKTCGVRTFAQGDHASQGGKFYAIAVHCSASRTGGDLIIRRVTGGNRRRLATD